MVKISLKVTALILIVMTLYECSVRDKCTKLDCINKQDEFRFITILHHAAHFGHYQSAVSSMKMDVKCSIVRTRN